MLISATTDCVARAIATSSVGALGTLSSLPPPMYSKPMECFTRAGLTIVTQCRHSGRLTSFLVR